MRAKLLAAACLVLALAWPGSLPAVGPVLLAPSGPSWLGPLPPGCDQPVCEGRESVYAHPRSGELLLQRRDLPPLASRHRLLQVERRYEGGQWIWPWRWRLETDENQQLWARSPEGRQALTGPPPLSPGEWEVGAELSGGGITLVRESQSWTLERSPDQREGYDLLGRLLWMETVHGRAQLRYEGQQVLIRDEHGETLTLTLNESGLPESVRRESSGDELRYRYEDERLIAVEGSPQARREFYYRDEGLLSGIVWGDGARLRVIYDDEERVRRFSGPGSLSWDFRWGADTVDIRGGRGEVRRVQWKPRGEGELLVLVQDDLGQQVSALLRGSRLQEWTDPKGLSWRLQQDEAGRPIQLEAPGSRRWLFQWREGQLRELTDPLGSIWRYQRNRLGGLMQVTDPLGRVTRYQRDARGVLTSVDREGEIVRWMRDMEGRLVGVQFLDGSRVILQRDGQGRLTKVIDANGEEILLLEHEGAHARALLSREGAMWRLERDSLGRPRRVEGPDGEAMTFLRDQGGGLSGLQNDQGLGWSYHRDSLGRVTRVSDPQGSDYGLIYDPRGQLRALRRPDLVEISVTRDAYGQWLTLSGDGRTISVVRDNQGLPQSSGSYRWSWDLNGSLESVTSPLVELGLDRDASGILEGLETPVGRVELRRNLSGRVVGVEGLGESWELTRDLQGRILSLQSEGRQSVERSLDSMGRTTRLSWKAGHLRYLRDREGRVLRGVSASSHPLSGTRDHEGRPELVHYPGGVLVEHRRSPGEREWVWKRPNGETAMWERSSLDLSGREVRRETLEGQSWIRRDPTGAWMVIEEQEGAWIRHPTGWTSSHDGYEVERSVTGLPLEVKPPVGVAAWGIAHDSLSYQLSDEGVVERLLGDQASIDLGYDVLGRLTALSSIQGSWFLRWDLLGRLDQITTPDGNVIQLFQGEEGLLGFRGQDELLRQLLHVEDMGWVISHGGERTVLVADAHGNPAGASTQEREGEDWLEVDEEQARWSPWGYPLEEWWHPVAWRGGLSLFAGGPLIDARGAWDPSAGCYLGDPLPLGWGEESGPEGSWAAWEGSGRPAWDPHPWKEDSPWSDPLRLLAQLGMLEEAQPGSWMGFRPPRITPAWLPEDSLAPPPPLAPAAQSLPVPEDLGALEELALRAALDGQYSLDSESLFSILLEEELRVLDQPSLGWMLGPGRSLQPESFIR